ncbi:MAG: hypothetical protein ACR2OE_02840 [Thermomicrobiales bacterium]
MPIRASDLQAAMEKHREAQAALDKQSGTMGQPSSTWFFEELLQAAGGDAAARSNLLNQGIVSVADSVLALEAQRASGILNVTDNVVAGHEAQLKAAMTAAIAPGANLSALVKTTMASMASTMDSGLGKMLEDLERRRQDVLEHYRPLAYPLIASEHLEHAMARIDWTAFMAAQRPGLTEQDAAERDPRQVAVLAERNYVADVLDSRLKEPEVKRRVATELLAYAWGTWDGMREDATISDMLAEFLPDAGSWAALSSQTLEVGYLHKILNAPGCMPIMRPAYGENGYGFLISDGITNGTRRALLGEALWRPIPSTSRPEMSHSLGKSGGYAHYTIDSAIFPTPEDAFAVVRRYGLGHLDIFHYILELWLANRDKERRGPFDGIYFGIEKFLDDRNVARHKNGYHKPENIEDVVAQVQALEHLMVSGSVPQPNKRSKQPPLKVSAHIVNITHWVTQPRLDGTEKHVACYVRPGDWAAQMQDMSPQFAIAMISVLQLNNKNQYLQKQIALYLLEQFKIRSSYGTFNNPFYVETLLEGACIPTDRKNPARFRSRVEVALNDLAKLDPPVIKSWHYVDQLPNGGHGMLDKWLQTRIRFMPTQQLKQGYVTIQENRQSKREQNRKRTKALKPAANA